MLPNSSIALPSEIKFHKSNSSVIRAVHTNTTQVHTLRNISLGWATSLVGGPDLLKKFLRGPD